MEIEIEIFNNGAVHGWCKDLKAIGFGCPLDRESCEGCYCG